MDVAAFVGFAAAGPLHTPVAVESVRRFRDIFGPDPAHGPDPALAWDEERGELRRAHLGGAVEAFFAGGGVRAWVVRVADGAAAAQHEFAVPGLIDAEDRGGSPLDLARARARAAGSWCEDLSVGAALLRDPLPLHADPATPAVVLATGGYRVHLSADRSRVQAGDLLEVGFGANGPVLLLFADRVTAVPGGLRVESAAAVSGVTAGAFWVQPSPVASPPTDVLDPEATPPLPLAEAAGIAAALAALGSPALRPTVRRLSFELLAWRGTELHRRIGDLAFAYAHPRCWARLPVDKDLFELPIGTAVAVEPAGLAREASSPRFPLAGPATPAAYYLPWGMGRRRQPEAALSLPAEATAGSSALERDGLARFGAGLFVDERLAPVGAGALLREAEHRFYVAEQRLQGVHSLLPIEEASLVAVPDAVHRGWSRALPEEPPVLGAPILDAIPDPDVAGRLPVRWSAVPTADGYTLQWDEVPAFGAAKVAFEGEAQAAAVTLPAACPRTVFFRVRAFRGGEVGPWSNTRAARLPREDFAPCDDERPGGLVLDFTGDAATPGPALTWLTEELAAPLPDGWKIEEATDPGFATAVSYAPEDMTAGYAPLPERRFAARYYRVRGVQDGVHGPWSNTVRVGATERAAFTEVSAREYDPTVLLAVHRALLRFAAARGDLLAVLGLPDHYRVAEALQHTGQLTPGGLEEEPAPAVTAPLFPRVAPLTEGEAPVLSFGALYHPWMVSRAGLAADAELRRLPPDGAATGLMAAVALSGGAWRAPANRPFRGALALDPPLGPGAWRLLVPARVNVVLSDPRGFLTLSEETLGGEGGLERVHVRRLMTLLRRLALREGQRFVFEPHGGALRRRVRDTFQRFLGELFHRGAFAGKGASEAFRVVTDTSVNPPDSVDRGRLVVELRVAPAAALNFLTVRLVTAGPAGLAVEEA